MSSLPRLFAFSPCRSFASAVALAMATLVFMAALPARADIWSTTTLTSSGTSINGTPIAGLATLTMSGTTLTVQLSNASSATSAFRSDILTSFYFDIVKSGSIRPALTYVSGSGYAWQVFTAAADVPVNYSPPMPGGLVPSGTGPHLPADLVAVNTNDDTWQFRSWTLGPSQWDVTKFPQTGFGIGTVGNSGTMAGTFFNTFNGAVVDGINFGIYRADGDLSAGSNSLNGLALVRNTATFTFTSPDLVNFTCSDVQPYHVFGFGTGPETILTPEPGTTAVVAAATGAAAVWLIRRRKRFGQRAVERLRRG